LAPLQGNLALRRYEFKLSPLPIGLLLPVIFPIEITNVGSSKIRYMIDKEKLYKNNSISGDYKVFDIENPESTLTSNEKNHLFVLFRPAEARKYNFTLPIEVFDLMKAIQEFEITFEGEGYLDKPLPPIAMEDLDEIPRQRSSTSQSGSKAFFSIEEIDFGTTKRKQPEYRMIILYNNSTTNKLSFAFQGTKLICKDSMSINPSYGDINAGEFMEIKITLTSNYYPSFYEGEIECMITWTGFDGNKPPGQITSRSFYTAKSNEYRGGDNQQQEKEKLFLRVKKLSEIDIVDQMRSKELRKMVINTKEKEPKPDTFFHSIINR